MEEMPIEETRRLFDESAATYDRVNTVISLGLDSRWRKWAARRAVMGPNSHVLDAFAGTGRTGIRAAELGADVTLADMSRGMLAEADAQARRRGVSVHVIESDLGEVEHLPGAPFDALTLTFGIRYLAEPARVLARIARLLKPGARVVLLDFTEPDRGIVSKVAGAYFFGVLPKIASALSGRSELYRLLVRTTHEIEGPWVLEDIVAEAGLRLVGTKVMGFGLVTGVVAYVPQG